MSRPYTSIVWRCGDAALEIELAQTLPPEAWETVLNRARREFVAGCRQLGFGAQPVEDEVDH